MNQFTKNSSLLQENLYFDGSWTTVAQQNSAHNCKAQLCTVWKYNIMSKRTTIKSVNHFGSVHLNELSKWANSQEWIKLMFKTLGKIQLAITEINYIWKYIKIENCYF